MLSFYIDPEKLDVSEFFSRDVTRYLDYIKGSKPVREGEEILVPGEPESRNRAERTRNGIPLPDDIWATLLQTARELGVTPPGGNIAPR
jgi:uncharacterized oxidoreductase